MHRRLNKVERLFRRLKGLRLIISRFEKLEVIFVGFISFALIVDAPSLCQRLKLPVTRSRLLPPFQNRGRARSRRTRSGWSRSYWRFARLGSSRSFKALLSSDPWRRPVPLVHTRRLPRPVSSSRTPCGYASATRAVRRGRKIGNCSPLRLDFTLATHGCRMQKTPPIEPGPKLDDLPSSLNRNVHCGGRLLRRFTTVQNDRWAIRVRSMYTH